MKRILGFFLVFIVTSCLLSTAHAAEPLTFSTAHAVKPFTLEKGKTALIVVDMQNDFVRDGGLRQTKAAKATLSAIKKLIDFFHSSNMPVIYTRVVNRFKNFRVKLSLSTRPRAMEGNPIVPGHKRYFSDVKKELDVVDVVDEIYPQKGDYVIDKDLFDSFLGTNLDFILKSHGIQYVLVTGTATDTCVETTAKGAFNHGYDASIVSDAVSSSASDPFIKELLAKFGIVWGRVMTSDEAIQELSH